ncbi:hypothetical protein DPMN_187736 [Dreissena polymorpha]|uniref:CCHC-type domain-containing protein n=1 Tax=Dreissena polymorpha TaxID=45954 RepID=A0A9D4DQT5_DREPO|nr:hypothetical protein DPMN_187736 [Dreissena polymorpha]
MQFGQFIGRVLHNGQPSDMSIKSSNCSKCLQDGHSFKTCPNDWVCTKCKLQGHKQFDCDIDTETLCDTNTTHSNTDCENVKPVDTSIIKHAPTLRSRSASATRSTTSCSQQSIIRFTESIHAPATSTPNKGRQMNATTRSPPTPASGLIKNYKTRL